MTVALKDITIDNFREAIWLKVAPEQEHFVAPNVRSTFTNELSIDGIEIHNMPNVPGLTFRHFRGASDCPGMVAALNASEAANGVERIATVDEITNNYAHLVNCDLAQDLIIPSLLCDGAPRSRRHP
jgi:hypothetical protein